VTVGKKRILIIDDEVDFAKILKLNLEETGAYEVRVENKGAQGLAAARDFKPDLVLLDIIMPDKDGREVAAQIGVDKHLRQTPIVFLTGIASDGKGPIQSGIIDGHATLTKPVGTEDVVECIERHLRK